MNRHTPDQIDTCNITLAIGCSLNCKYCPQDLFVKRYFEVFGKSAPHQMTFDTFKAVIKNVKKTGCITLGGFSEPFKNPECVKMIHYAEDNGYRICLNTTLVGLSEDDYSFIKNTKFVETVLHIPDQEGNSKFIITNEYLEIFKKFNKEIKFTCYSCHGTIHRDILPYIDHSLPIQNSFGDRAGNLKNDEVTHSVYKKGKVACILSRVDGFHAGLVSLTPTILPNGFAALCCSDWGLKHIIGDFSSQTIPEIANTNVFREYLKASDSEDLPFICRNCDTAHARSKFETNGCPTNLLVGNAIKVGLYLDDISDNKVTTSYITPNTRELFEKIINAKNVCIYGVGKLFNENHNGSSWNKVINATILSDRSEEKWGQEYFGLKCVNPMELETYQDLVVITYVKNDKEIVPYLNSLGICNIINIYKIFNIFD